MKKTQKVAAIVLVILLGAAAYGIFRTGQPRAVPKGSVAGEDAPQTQATVDQTPLSTARRLAQLATDAEEKPLAQEALRLADYEVDLAFDAALHDAKEHPPVLRGEAKEIADRLEKAQKMVQDQQAQVEQLTKAAEKATGDKKEALQDDLAVAQADLNLGQSEVADAKQDLIRAGGDPESRIQAMQKEHKDAEQSGLQVGNAVASAELPGLIHRIERWWALHEKQMQLWDAKAQAEAAAKALSAQHDALDAQVEQEKANSPHLARHSKKKLKSSGNPATPVQQPDSGNENAATLLVETKHVASNQKALAVLDERIDAEKELAAIYNQWANAVAARQRTVVHRALIGLAIILGIVLIGLYFDGWIENLLGRTRLDRRQVETLRTVARVSLQVAGVLFILLMIFGPPGQLGTFLGLAGAGLTVALKDFIVGFLGWFVLMGKNGVRLGDWVEINGVTGEVVELGMFHTVLLETGNWTDSGHPTGRRVTFTNSYAIEGHYFNFSTSGQWMWDELQVVLPTGQDPNPIIAAIQKKVAEATTETAKQAEQEWKSAASSRQMTALSAAPAINVRPVIGGIEIAVRYITRANERYQLRAKLYAAAVELLGQKAASQITSPAPNPASD